MLAGRHYLIIAERMVNIGVISMGEMGARIARRLTDNGARVVTSLEGRSEASRKRAEWAKAEVFSDAEMVQQSEVILSIVPPSVALSTAIHIMPLIKQFGGKKVYIDCNAIAPETLTAMADEFVVQGLLFGDASIIGSSPKPGTAGPRLYMSGNIDQEALLLRSFGIDARVLSDSLGEASALKMAYAGITKGFQALGTSMAIGAANHGVTTGLVAELQASQPALYGILARQLPSMYSKAYRWDGEMNEIAKFLQPEAGAVTMLEGASELYRHVAEENLKPESDFLEKIHRFTHPQDDL